MLVINKNISIPEKELVFSAIRAQGAGGQNVNKVATAVQLRFDIRESSLPAYIKQKLLSCDDRRISGDGSVIIKAQEFRSQARNRQAALERLQGLIRGVCVTRKKRIPTRPGLAVKEKRLESKTRRGHLKKLRSKSIHYE